MRRKETSQLKAVLLPGWGTLMITIAYQNRTVQIHKPGLQLKAGKQKRENNIEIPGLYPSTAWRDFYCPLRSFVLNSFQKIFCSIIS
jgi:hypothetical protein